jgi:hypothetical protein
MNNAFCVSLLLCLSPMLLMSQITSVTRSAGVKPLNTAQQAGPKTETVSFEGDGKLPPVSFGSANVCPKGQSGPAPCSQMLSLPYIVAATTTFGPIKVVTQGALNLDFTLGTGSTCTGTVSAGNACTVNATFAPIAPGLRVGAVQLFDSTGNLLDTTFVNGTGQGPAIAFQPGLQIVADGG